MSASEWDSATSGGGSDDPGSDRLALVNDDVQDKRLTREVILRKAIEGSFAVMHEVTMAPWPNGKVFPFFLFIFDALQLLHMPLSPAAAMPWKGQPLMDSLYDFLLTVQLLPTAAYKLDKPPVVMFIAAVVFALAVLGLFAWEAYAHVASGELAGNSGSSSRQASDASGRGINMGSITPPVHGPAIGLRQASSGSTGIGSNVKAGAHGSSGGGSGSGDGRHSGAGSSTGRMSRNGSSASWRMTLLRILLRLSTVGLAVPLAASLTAPMSCRPKTVWLTTTMTCFSGGHSALLVVSILVAPVTMVFTLLVAACYVNRIEDPSGKRNALSAPHGRIEALALIIRWLYALLATFAPIMSGWAMTIIGLALACTWIWAFAWMLPYHRQLLNKLQAAIGAVLAMACVCSSLSLALKDPLNNAGTLLLLVTVPIVAYGGQAAAAYRYVALRSAGSLPNPFVVELRARLILAKALRSQNGGSRASGIGGRNGRLDDGEDGRLGLVSGVSDSGSGGMQSSRRGHRGGTDDDDDDDMQEKSRSGRAATPIGTERRRPSVVGTASGQATPAPRSRRGSIDSQLDPESLGLLTMRDKEGRAPLSPDNPDSPTGLHAVATGEEGEEEEASAVVGVTEREWVGVPPDEVMEHSERSRSDYGTSSWDALPPAVKAVADTWKNATSAFVGSAFCHLFVAHFHGVVCANRHLERIHLSLAQSSARSIFRGFDVHFFVYQRRAQLRDDEGLTRIGGSAAGGASSTSITGRSAKTTMTVERRMLYESTLEAARRQLDVCRQHVLSFWTVLAERNPDLPRLLSAGRHITSTFARTDATLSWLVQLCPNSAMVLKEYAQFLVELSNDPRKAMELMTDAEQLEDEAVRAKSLQVPEQDMIFGRRREFDISVDGLAVIRVSAAPDSMGIIMDANGPALAVLGYTRRELLGRDVSIVIPAPFAAVHGDFLLRYAEDGREHIVNSSRSYFALHREGHLVPLECNIRPTGNDWSMVANEVRTPSLAFLFATGGITGWRVHAACKNGMDLLGIDPTSLRAGVVTLLAHLDDPRTVVAQALTNKAGALVMMHNLKMRVNQTRGGGSASGRGKKSSRHSGSGGDVSSDAGSYSGSGGDSLEAGRSSDSDGGGRRRRRRRSGSGDGSDDDDEYVTDVMGRRRRRNPDAATEDSSIEGGGEEEEDDGVRDGWVVGSIPMVVRVQRIAVAGIPIPVLLLRIRRAQRVDLVTAGWLSTAEAAGEPVKPPPPPPPPAEESKKMSLLERTAARAPSKFLQALLAAKAAAAAKAAEAAAAPAGAPADAVAAAGAPAPGAPVDEFAGIKGDASTAGEDVSLCPLGFKGTTPPPGHPAPAPAPAAAPADDAAARAAAGGAAILRAMSLGPAKPTRSRLLDSFMAAARATAAANQAAAVEKSMTAESGGATPATSTTPTPGATEGAAAPPSHPYGAKGGLRANSMALSLKSLSSAVTGGSGEGTPIVAGTPGAGTGDAPAGGDAAASGPRPGAGLAALKNAKTRLRATALLVMSTQRSFRNLKALDNALMAGEVATSKEPESSAPSRAQSFHDSAAHGRGPGRRMSGPTQGGSGSGNASFAGGSPSGASGTHAKSTSGFDRKISGRSHGTQGTRRGGDKSVASRGTASSGSTLAVGEVVRRGVLARATVLEPSLRLLRRGVLLVFLVASVVNIASLALTSSLFATFDSDLSRLVVGGNRLLALQAAATGIHRAWTMARALTPATYANITLDRAYKDIEQFAKITDTLYLDVDSSDKEQELFIDPLAVTVYDPAEPMVFVSLDEYTAVNRTSSSMNAGAEFVAKARRVLSSASAALPASLATIDPATSRDVFWVLFNSRGSLPAALNTTLLASSDRAASQTDQLSIVALVVLGVAVTAFGLVGIGLVVPAVLSIARDKGSVLHIFLEVPVPVVRALRTRSYKLLATMRQGGAASSANLGTSGATSTGGGNTPGSFEHTSASDHASQRGSSQNLKAAAGAPSGGVGARSALQQFGTRSLARIDEVGLTAEGGGSGGVQPLRVPSRGPSSHGSADALAEAARTLSHADEEVESYDPDNSTASPRVGFASSGGSTPVAGAAPKSANPYGRRHRRHSAGGGGEGGPEGLLHPLAIPAAPGSESADGAGAPGQSSIGLTKVLADMDAGRLKSRTGESRFFFSTWSSRFGSKRSPARPRDASAVLPGWVLNAIESGGCWGRMWEALCCYGSRFNAYAGAALAATGSSRSKSKRHFRRAKQAGGNIVLRLLWPFVAYVGYYIGTYFYRVSAVTFAKAIRVETLWAHRLSYHVADSYDLLVTAYTQWEPHAVTAAINGSRNAAALLSMYQNGLLYGSPTHGLRNGLSTSSSLFTLFLEDGCVAEDTANIAAVEAGGYPVATSPPGFQHLYTALECRIFSDGVVAKGLLPASREYMRLLGRALNEREERMRYLVAEVYPNITVTDPHTGATHINATAAAAAALTAMPDAMLYPPLHTLSELALKYLPAGFQSAADIKASESSAYFAEFVAVDAGATISAIMALFLVYAVLYAPQISRLDTEIKHIRHLLLLFPDQVAQRVPAISDAGRSWLYAE